MKAMVSTQVKKPPKDVEVLGEHVYQKVSEVFVSKEDCLISKITGMLLERPRKEIHEILRDETVLIDCVCQVLSALHQGGLLDVKEGQDYHLAYADLGEIIFSKVYRYDSLLAPNITGMLIELDFGLLLEVVTSESETFKEIVEKARKTLSEQENTGPLSLVATLSKKASSLFSPLRQVKENSVGNIKLEAGKQVIFANSGMKDLDNSIKMSNMPLVGHQDKKQSAEGVLEKETDSNLNLGELVYERSFELHPEHAAKITGMILELDEKTLNALFHKKDVLDQAIAKAHSSLTSLM